MKIVTEHLQINHHQPWEDKANEEVESIYYYLSEKQCENIINTLYEVDFEIDSDTGKVLSVQFSNGERFIAPESL